MRPIPARLAAQVRPLIEDATTDPYVRDAATGLTALERLAALNLEMTARGEPDPFLTEIVAALTLDNATSIRLYEAAINQCAAFPDEPPHTKRFEMALRLIELGDKPLAAKQLIAAISEAQERGDSECVDLASGVLSRVAG